MILVNKNDRFLRVPGIARGILDSLSTYIYADLKEHRKNIYAFRYIEDYARLASMKDIDIGNNFLERNRAR
jgi:hypothetical protein